ncbi:Pre-mRNA-splicing factor [Lachnellula hyalina]|uniref:Pre-mRNA-splicing factor n=1 Tax=Lachnellula hyalina TaxID=1316788 RepID=A0A8H8TX45_9HELO|nr:Pre-mRNA-splicing factor [Lachnellula hyalina]TVY23950.1 Pre-mRNA-splicing factor [Lachnellula hyalina]
MTPSKDSPPSTGAPKIAIKGFSLSKSKPGTSKPSLITKPVVAKPPSSLGKRPRSTFPQHDDSDNDSESERRGKHEVVTGFGEEGAINQVEKEKEGPLIIPSLKNSNRRAAGASARGGGKNLLPAEVQAEAREREAREKGEGEIKTEEGEKEETKWGLSVRKKEAEEPATGDKVDIKAEETKVKIEELEIRPVAADDEALQALLGNEKSRKGPDLIIPAHLSEETAYAHAIATAPPSSTLEDYERVPIEEFGAALLRGMGWDGETKKDGKAKDIKRRQNLLGLGAKELEGAEELGAWVQKADVKRLKPAGSGKGRGNGERRPRVSEYKREEERKREKREERGGGSYRSERERERGGGRDRDGYRDSGRDRERERDRDRRRH